MFIFILTLRIAMQYDRQQYKSKVSNVFSFTVSHTSLKYMISYMVTSQRH